MESSFYDVLKEICKKKKTSPSMAIHAAAAIRTVSNIARLQTDSLIYTPFFAVRQGVFAFFC